MEIINLITGSKDAPATKNRILPRHKASHRATSNTYSATESLLFPQFNTTTQAATIKKARKPLSTAISLNIRPMHALKALITSNLIASRSTNKITVARSKSNVATKTTLWTLLIVVSIFAMRLFYRVLLNNSEFTAPSQSPITYMPIVPATDGAILNHKMQNFATLEAKPFDDAGFLSGSNKTPLVSTKPVKFTTYKVQSGDTIVAITRRVGLNNISTLIAVNDIDNCSALCAGQTLKIPSIDGLFYTVESGKTLEGISAKFCVPLEELIDVNELESSDLTQKTRLFIPGATLDKATLEAAIGTFFKTPLARYRISSYFGRRLDPITGVKSHHTGLDMAAAMGTPISASCSGTVSTAGFSNIFGNYVIINHSNGYQTLYGHMSRIIAKKGQWVSQGTQIGFVGSTGYSTGPHLHFTVYKNGRLVDPLPLIK